VESPLHYSALPVRGQRGYTLIEILIVVAIIGVLAAMAFPALKRARASANAAKALSHLQQLATAQNLYANDNDGKFTPIWNVDQIVWQAKLLPYLFDRLPTNEELGKIKKAKRITVFDVPEFNGTGSSIAMNWSINGKGSSGQGWEYSRMAVPRKSSIILLGEMIERNSDTMVPHDDASSSGMNAPATPGFRRDNGKRALMAFVDGHVEALDAEALKFKGKTTANNLWRWW